MERHNCVQGDETTTGGYIVGASDMRMTNKGKPFALEGDEVYCPACETMGRILCVGPHRNNSFHGRKDALEGDLCICKCDPKPQLIASMTNVKHRFTHEELVALGYAKSPVETGFTGEVGLFDEQVQLSRPIHGRDLAGLPFLVQTTDGRRFAGQLDSNGQLPRIATEGPGMYEIFWGDEALARV
ncbi:PAAR domain-containing protein [Paraburkholderia saeva]|jgi:uncharacterized Zn-binding protein involved in type VI secretion|uniref:PAAR domain-containing protein n=1 Tax=Paraburkholderia saeva TaxID=2777537 RepID=A0A9N8X0N9_9BURK|nr:PAAR domain-containing protein [Paraburkholderia saeva]CAG4890832.1 hypothetical protein LMG31841_01232 [Paraburkholderia saeva]CAG4894036.1 hypothetical protein R52603_01716 [Paraburkholderia saeva]